MARKYAVLILVLVVLTVCNFSLLTAIFGKTGYLVNRELEKQLKINEYRLDRDEVELENLRIQEQELSTEDGVRFAAMNLGYKVEGDDVYQFETEDEVQAVSDSQTSTVGETEETSTFEPWGFTKLFLVAFSISLAVTVLIWILRRKKEEENDSQQNEPRDFGDSWGAY
jgi:preprotein translocase subunit SecF